MPWPGRGRKRGGLLPIRESPWVRRVVRQMPSLRRMTSERRTVKRLVRAIYRSPRPAWHHPNQFQSGRTAILSRAEADRSGQIPERRPTRHKEWDTSTGSPPRAPLEAHSATRHPGTIYPSNGAGRGFQGGQYRSRSPKNSDRFSKFCLRS